MKKIAFLIFFNIFFAHILFTEETENKTNNKGTIIVKVIGLRNNKGKVGVALYNTKSSFPKRSGAFKKAAAAPSKGVGTVYFKNMQYGTYAVGVLHDENKNNRLDKSVIGIPNEGVGVSNNPSLRGRPTWKQACFTLDSETKTIVIKIKYIKIF